ncbi:hypothetical protein GCM10011349_25950 [Novosphingobium indicum]|uniref:DUF3604 domain-containing protein n=1 Tax=Novosphingobium indicum TaxID=462949 RepID=A0ABQ2JSD3_9SPHN|nr:DUF3604 domain-containing protein [Novosphingobium indicum]GGN52426.1 hypothetical protein GCM10011349_25950 [Novosphingobium indicum]
MRKSYTVALALCLAACSSEKEETSGAEANDTSAEADVPQNPLKEAYFGETHVHTGVSMDAFIGGNRLTPEDAYRFATGEQIMVNGSMHKIKRPLDFAAVTDHSEFMGEAYSLMNPGAPGYDDPVAKSFREAKDLKTALGLYGKYVLTPLAGGGDRLPLVTPCRQHDR